MPVCEGLVGASLQALFDSLDSPELVNFACQCGVEADLIQGMEDKFLEILPVINDAEEKQFKSKLVKRWLAELKDVVYDVEDVFDLIQTESLCCKLKQSDSPSHTDNASPLQVLLDPSTSSVTSTEHCSALNDKIKKITKRLEGIARRKEGLGLIKGTPGTSVGGGSIVIMEPRLPTSSLEDEPSLYGRDTDVEKLIKLLLSAEPCNANVGVIPIVGQGGIGKTTFAQRLYNHMAVEKHFQLRAWVCVSDVFDVIRVTKGIIESASGLSCNQTQLPALHEELKKTLAGKKFLLVLDDIWTEEYKDWIALSSPFGAGAKGSKVIITTRSENVCSITGTVPSHHLNLLSEEDCFKLLKRHAFSIQNSDAQPALERIGKEIARKCKGLPLATKALGGLLRTKLGEAEWEGILDSEIWDLETELGPALWLSYHYLPAHLKRCFAYCGIIPKDFEFGKEKLICLWMAEGFVEQKAENHKKRMEDIGEGYFCELVSRSFFQQSGDDQFVMHDLVHDLARVASGETCLTTTTEHWEKLISERTRHVSYWGSGHQYEDILKSEAFYRANKLRTYASFGEYWLMRFAIRVKVAPELLSRLVCLRVLCLNSCDIVELPESIGNLVHLRYLGLSYTSIKRLPESINALCNLQTLLLQKCVFLEELHINTGKLINLRCLDLSECDNLQKMPQGIGRLKELQMLPYFIVDENNDIGIEELTNLEHLRGTLLILGLDTIRDPIHKKINLRNKQHLRTLELIWDNRDLEIDSEAKSVAELVLDLLQPHANLERLTIRGYYGTCLPSWPEDPSLPDEMHCLYCLEELQIYECPRLLSFPEGGLPSTKLKCLTIEGCEDLKSLPNQMILLTSLEKLRIVGCPNLLSIPEGGLSSINLRDLQIDDCKGLKSLGNQQHSFTSLRSLSITDCPALISFPENLFSPHLESLTISIVSNTYRPLSEWKSHFHEFTSLRMLVISGCEGIESLSDLLLPSTLTNFEIMEFPNLKALPNGLQHLTSLESLTISECPKVSSLPDQLLPTKLRVLSIYNCFLLEQWCKSITEWCWSNKREDWPSLANIPRVVIDLKAA